MVESIDNENPNGGSALKAETTAPDFTLPSGPDEKVSLSDFRGRPVILAFYPADWSPVCGDQMALYNEVLPEFNRFNAELLGVSVDGVSAFSADPPLGFSLSVRSTIRSASS